MMGCTCSRTHTVVRILMKLVLMLILMKVTVVTAWMMAVIAMATVGFDGLPFSKTYSHHPIRKVFVVYPCLIQFRFHHSLLPSMPA